LVNPQILEIRSTQEAPPCVFNHEPQTTNYEQRTTN